MGLRDDGRGQAVQVGAVLLLAVFVVTLSLYQATVIPHENRQVEFGDYQDATGDLADLRNAILHSAARDAQFGTTVRTGSQYPARTLFVNPPPATGRLTSTPAANATISNVTIAGDYENVGTYLTAEDDSLNVSTRRLVFEPAYHELDVAPLATAYGATYRAYDDPVFLTDQTLVDGNRITLVSVAGDLHAEGYTASVTVEPVSAHTRTISITGDGGPVNLTVPTELSASTWEELLAGQMAPARHVLDVTPGPRPNTVNVSLDGDETYELRLGRVEVRERSDSPVEPTPEPRYVVSADKRLTTDDDNRVQLAVETRDRFNNPTSNANVTFDAPVGHFETRVGTNLTATTTVRTDAEGQATVWFNATDNYGNHDVKAYLGDAVDDTLAAEKRLTFVVTNPPSEGTGGEGFIIRKSATPTDPDSPVNPQSYGSVTLTLNNTGSSSINMTGIGLSYITEENSNGKLEDGPDAITEVTLDPGPLTGESRTVNATEIGPPEFFRTDPLELATGESDVKFTFDQNYDLTNEEAVMVTVRLYFEGGITVTYSVFLFG